MQPHCRSALTHDNLNLLVLCVAQLESAAKAAYHARYYNVSGANYVSSSPGDQTANLLPLAGMFAFKLRVPSVSDRVACAVERLRALLTH